MLQSISICLKDIVVPGVGALLIAFLANLARYYIRRIKDERLRQLLLELVKAAEQIYGSGKGAAKRRYVLQQARRVGYPDVTRQEVETAVFDMNRADFAIAALAASAEEEAGQ